MKEGLLKLFNLVPLLSEPGPVITTETPAPQQQNPHFSPQGSGPGLATAKTAPGSLDGLGTAPRLAPSLGFRRGPRRSGSEAGLRAGADTGPEGHRGAQASGVGCWGRQPGARETTPEAPRDALCHGSPPPRRTRSCTGGRGQRALRSADDRAGPGPGTRQAPHAPPAPRGHPPAPRSPKSPARPLRSRGLAAIGSRRRRAASSSLSAGR